MRPEHVKFLKCPASGEPLELVVTHSEVDGRIRSGKLLSRTAGHEYPIVDYIPRFVPPENYAGNFGFQWNLHDKTQLDAHARTTLSETRFFEASRWSRRCEGEVMLEVGCGAGRFTQQALSTGATVISVDYSNAVDANYKAHGSYSNLLVAQADVFHLPVNAAVVDKVFCFGVLQHTPDPRRAFISVASAVRAGGSIATDIYLKSWKSYLHAKPYVRLLSRTASPETLYRFTRNYVDVFWPLARLMRGSRAGRVLISRLIAERSDLLPGAPDDVLREWAYLDTFDWFSPAFDFPQTVETFRRWHEEAGLVDIEVHRGHNGVEARALRPLSR